MVSNDLVKAEEDDTQPSSKADTPQKNGAAKEDGKSPAKKRRKVNHACIYCRRSHMTCDLERPCTRCIKRNIGHLCHDEPREPAKRKSDSGVAGGDSEAPLKVDTTDDGPLNSMPAPSRSDTSISLSSFPPPQISNAPLVQPTPVQATTQASFASSTLLSLQDWGVGSQSHLLQDMNTLHPQYMFNTSEVSAEYDLLNNFLSNSLLEDGALFSNDDPNVNINGLLTDSAFSSSSNNNVSNLADNMLAPVQQQPNITALPSQAAVGNTISRPASGFPLDKAREQYYMMAADPTGSEAPEERLKKLLKAKYDAGMLKPFNYVKGYARLNQFMERNLQPISRIKILKQLDKFRPKFRERVKGLTDMQLTYVEMHFERSLMEYDRVFASMAIPACCWRRTGEIYRGNKEMAELIHVPMENLRDGKIAIHEIFAENSLVSYWEKFGAIAFDSSQKAILTTCALKSLDKESKEPEMRCCFSFTIRRDSHNIPSLIVGNFLPILPSSSQK